MIGTTEACAFKCQKLLRDLQEKSPNALHVVVPKDMEVKNSTQVQIDAFNAVSALVCHYLDQN